MHCLEIALEHADEIDHRVAALHRRRDLSGRERRRDECVWPTAERLQEMARRGSRCAMRTRAPLGEQLLRDIAAEKAAAAEQSNQPVHPLA